MVQPRRIGVDVRLDKGTSPLFLEHLVDGREREELAVGVVARPRALDAPCVVDGKAIGVDVEGREIRRVIHVIPVRSFEQPRGADVSLLA